MNRRVLAALVAAALAILGAAVVIVYANNADQRAIAAAQPTTVWVSQKLVPAGTTLKDAQRTGLIAQTQVAARGVPVGALPGVTPDNSALLALSDVQPGEILLSARFGTTPVGQKAIEVPAGQVAVSVQLSDPARVGRFVTPGSHIAIYSTYKIKSLGDDPRSKKINELEVQGTSVLLPDALVIGMGDTPLAAPATAPTASPTDPNAPAGAGFLVTVAVAPDQATRLIHAISGFKLYAALRGSDVKLDPKSQTNDMSIFGPVTP